MRSAMFARCALSALILAAAVAGCGDAAPAASKAPAGSAVPLAPLIGIEPSKFRCESLLTTDQLGELAHGTAKIVENSLPPPDGTAAPCTYVVETARGSGTSIGGWSFDIDCRPRMRERADELFTQYRAQSAELVEAAALEAKKPRPKPAPGQPPTPPPNPNAVAPAVDVEVGARGLDHHGQGLIFIDDDAPCYVRVTGPDAAGRMALATHLAAALHPATAPMSPRAAEPS